jgi:GT2 family glycosyltransferase
MLFRREAFYEIDGFYEDYFGYCSDDDTCMKLRQSGWKIIYQPHAEGVHMEGQSFIKLTGDRGSLVREAGEIFEKKWGWWLDKNINTVPGNF